MSTQNAPSDSTLSHALQPSPTTGSPCPAAVAVMQAVRAGAAPVKAPARKRDLDTMFTEDLITLCAQSEGVLRGGPEDATVWDTLRSVALQIAVAGGTRGRSVRRILEGPSGFAIPVVALHWAENLVEWMDEFPEDDAAP